MGSLENGSTNDLEDENLYSPESIAQKNLSTQAAEQWRHPAYSQAHVEKMFGNVYRSIKTVIFSNRLNLLMPFGPSAILVNKFTGHRVSLNSSSLVVLQIAVPCIMNIFC